MPRGRNARRARAVPPGRRPPPRPPRAQKKRVERITLQASMRYLNPEFHRIPPASAISLGKFTTVNSRVAMSGNTSTTLWDFVCVQWTPSALASFGWSHDGASAVGQFMGRRYLPYLDGGVSAPAPLSIKPLRSSFSIRNFTQDNNVSGVCKILILSDPVEWGFITNQADLVPSLVVAQSILAMMNTHPSVRAFTGRELSKTHTFVQGPSSNIGYNQYLNFNLNSSTDVSTWGSVQTALIAGADANAMQTAVIMFPPSNVAENYEVTVHRQDGCRYPANLLLASTAEPQAIAESTFIHKMHTTTTNMQADRPTAMHEAAREALVSGARTAGSNMAAAAINAAGVVASTLVGQVIRARRGRNGSRYSGPKSMG